MKKSMDIFGEALYAYWKGDKKSKLFLIDSSGKNHKLPQRIYFRNYNQLTKLEKKLISLCKGRILDVGCATGYYISFLMKRGEVEGIDISEKAVKVAKERGLKNCRVANIFTFRSNKKYDTITLLQNNLGMAKNLPKTNEMLKILSKLLRKNGQILLIHRKTKEKYHINKLRFQYKNKISPKFRWIYINTKFLSRLCNEIGLKIQIIDKNRYYNLIRITK